MEVKKSPIALGVDLSGRTLYVDVPANYTPTMTHGEVNLFACGSNRVFLDTVRTNNHPVPTSRLKMEYQGTTTAITTDFNPSPAKNYEINMPDDFGTVDFVNEDCPVYDKVTRDANEKVYVHNEDHERIEGITKEAFEALVARVAALEGN